MNIETAKDSEPYQAHLMNHAEYRNQQMRNLFGARELLTLAVLAVALLVTYKLWDAARRTADHALRTTFEFRAQGSIESIKQRLAIYEQVLRATVGFFNATETVNRAEFREFTNALSISERFPGIQGVGFAQIITPGNLRDHIRTVRAQGFPEYQVTPEGRRDFYTSIVYLEPFVGRNLRAFGFDMYSEPNRREAMAYARDHAQPAVSSKVILVQEGGGDIQWGFLMYLPVYRNDAPRSSLEDRRTNLLGWVYAPFRVDDFMQGIIGEYERDIDIEIYDDTQVVEGARMYDLESEFRATDPHSLKSIDRIVANNRIWTVVAAAKPEFEEKIRSDRPQLILQAGISISLMLSLLIWLFLDDRARALHAADQAMQLALYDALTGLPNRKLLDERLGQALSKARRNEGQVALLFMDLDRFKPVNDNYGHAYGDLLLKEVAKRLQGCMRESDTASRLGGDEFVALLSDVDGESAAWVVAEKILHSLTLPYEIAGHTFNISASIGVAIHPKDGTDAKTLVRNADLAMYEAKKAGRATVKFARAPEGKRPFGS